MMAAANHAERGNFAVAGRQSSQNPSAQEERNGQAANVALLTAIIVLTLVRLWLAANIGLVDDEAYYRIWTLAPSLSYLDHPPMVAWIIGAGRALAGDSTLGIRLLAPLLTAAGALLLWRTAFLLYGSLIARRAVWFMLAMPLLAVGGVIVTPDLPSVVFSGLTIWALAELDRSQNSRWWLAIGLFAGLGLLSKYTNLFLGATILLWLLAVPGNIKWFRAPELWIGGILAFVIASPIAIWNAEHHWVSFTKQFGRVAHSSSTGGQAFLELYGGFALLESPLIALLALIGFIAVIRSAILTRARSDALVAASILPMLIYFTVHAFHDRVQGNWPGPLYPFFAICAALGVSALPLAFRKPAFVAAVTLGFAMTGALYVHTLRPLFYSAKDPTEQIHGWSELIEAIEKKRAETGSAWIATSSYATTGQLMFGLRNRSPVAQLDERIRYEFLPPLPNETIAKPALYVELQRRVDLSLLKKKFAKIEPAGKLKRDNGSPNGATYMLFRVSDPIAPPLAMDDKL
jgi:hypothetical protein